jgi:hypothetical protein
MLIAMMDIFQNVNRMKIRIALLWRETREAYPICQMEALEQISENARLTDYFWLLFHRFQFAIYSRWNRIMRLFKPRSIPEAGAQNLSSGDFVRVKSIEEIRSTLNSRNELMGCTFMDEMAVYSGTTQRVYKRVERFIDERDYRVKRARGVVLLENVFCQGTQIFGRCDRSCFFFWREQWLDKISGQADNSRVINNHPPTGGGF